jgi:hypothetical protein
LLALLIGLLIGWLESKNKKSKSKEEVIVEEPKEEIKEEPKVEVNNEETKQEPIQTI